MAGAGFHLTFKANPFTPKLPFGVRRAASFGGLPCRLTRVDIALQSTQSKQCGEYRTIEPRIDERCKTHAEDL